MADSQQASLKTTMTISPEEMDDLNVIMKSLTQEYEMEGVRAETMAASLKLLPADLRKAQGLPSDGEISDIEDDAEKFAEMQKSIFECHKAAQMAFAGQDKDANQELALVVRVDKCVVCQQATQEGHRQAWRRVGPVRPWAVIHRGI